MEIIGTIPRSGKNRKLIFSISALALFILINNFIFFPGNILCWDVFGYYLYLPLKFIYHDLAIHEPWILNSIVAKYDNTSTLYQVMLMPNGNYVLKYSMGMSFFYAPFFFLGHTAALLFHYPADGFSLPYQYAILIGGIVYSIVGIYFLSKVLMRFFSERITLLVLLLIVFSTNYLVHVTMYGQNAMSHNYLFTAYAMILWFTIRWHDSHQIKYAIYLAIICGLAVLTRPSEIVCLIIPALWEIKNFKGIEDKLKLVYKYKIHILVFIIIIISIGMFQVVYWKIFSGKYLFYTYGVNAGEGFEFKNPHIVDVLLSFRKGWLIYTPIMIFAITGFYFVFKYNRSIFYALFIYFLANLYIISSWSTWWYASSFSSRPLIPSYPVMAIALGYLIQSVSSRKSSKIIFYSLFGLFVLLNLFQTAQFHYGTIDGERMTRDYYIKVFGKLKATTEDKNLLMVNRAFPGQEKFENEQDYTSRIIDRKEFESGLNIDSSHYHSGSFSFRLDSVTEFSPPFEAKYNELTKKDHAWIRVTAWVYPTKPMNSGPFNLIVHFIHNGFTYKYVPYESGTMNLELNQWNKISFDYITPEVRNTSDRMKTYFWNTGKSKVFIDDFQVEIFEKR